MAEHEGTPRPSLSLFDVIAIIVGLVIGAGIFKAPAMVAANVDSETALLLTWLLGGAVSLAGALCYAELAGAHPSTGGEYHFLKLAYGRMPSFLFAWARLTVLQTGSIALLAYVVGDYMAELLPLAPSAFYAAVAIVLLTAVNVIGLTPTKWVQIALDIFTVGGLIAIALALTLTSSVPATASTPSAGAGHPAFGLAMVFVLLTYGGWNEAAYVSAELRNPRRMVAALVLSIVLITGLYLLINFAYLRALGLKGMAGSQAVTADAVRVIAGEGGVLIVAAVIIAAVASSLNVTIMTGARSAYALARDFPGFGFLGGWRAGANAPAAALIVQGVLALALVLFGTLGRSGFEAMVQYVSPVFWLFFLLTGLSLFVLRRRAPQPHTFRVPLYPLTPLLFTAVCAYMFYASVAYAGAGAAFGLLVLAAGVPLYYFLRPGSALAKAHSEPYRR